METFNGAPTESSANESLRYMTETPEALQGKVAEANNLVNEAYPILSRSEIPKENKRAAIEAVADFKSLLSDMKAVETAARMKILHSSLDNENLGSKDAVAHEIYAIETKKENLSQAVLLLKENGIEVPSADVDTTLDKLTKEKDIYQAHNTLQTILSDAEKAVSSVQRLLEGVGKNLG